MSDSTEGQKVQALVVFAIVHNPSESTERQTAH